jgi:pimeloyl-ACP methyl ester carboxylesterase
MLQEVFSWLGMRTLPMDVLRQRYAQSPSRFVRVEGLDVHVRDEGQGPVLVLLHGVMASLHTWDDWVADLKKDHRVVRIDTPGHGLTGPFADGAYDPERYIRVIAGVLDALGVDTVSMIGNSMGGYLSALFAATHPQRVERLVVIDPAAYPMPYPALLGLAALPVMNSLVIPNALPRPIVSLGIHQVYGDASRIRPGVVDRYFDMTQREGNRRAFTAIVRTLGALRHTQPEFIKTIRAHTLVMWGEKDRWIPVAHVPLWQRDLRSSETVIYPDAGHIPMEEIPDRSVADVRRFLKAEARAVA